LETMIQVARMTEGHTCRCGPLFTFWISPARAATPLGHERKNARCCGRSCVQRTLTPALA
jgi:hypothetical protein